MSTPAFQRYQAAFCAHLRDPARQPRPEGTSARRVRVYQDLMYGNLRSFLDVCFPVAREQLGPRRWARLVRAFLAGHPCASPLFRDIPEAFVRWVAGQEDTARLPDWYGALLHHEWIELALDIHPGCTVVAGARPDGDLLGERPVVNPVSVLSDYAWAVHRIGGGAAPRRERTWMLAFRDHDDRVQFTVLNPLSARLWTLLQGGRLPGARALQRLARETGRRADEAFLEGGRQLLEGLRVRHALVGTRPTSHSPRR